MFVRNHERIFLFLGEPFIQMSVKRVSDNRQTIKLIEKRKDQGQKYKILPTCFEEGLEHTHPGNDLAFVHHTHGRGDFPDKRKESSQQVKMYAKNSTFLWTYRISCD